MTRRLLKNRVSDNVGGVKQLLSIPIRALGEERHFALVEMAVPTTGSLVIVVQVQTLGPTHASLRSRTAIMITTSNSSLKRSGTPNQLLGVLLHTIAISGLSRVRTESFYLFVVPFLAHHPKQLHGQAAGHSNFRNLPSTPQHQMKIFAAPLQQAAHRHLCRLHQQEAHYRTALLGDVSQAPAIPAGV